MTPDITLHHKLAEATRRIRLLMIFRWVSRTLCWSTLACVLWLVASRFNWVGEPEPRMLVLILSFAAVIGAILGGTRKLTTMDVARLTDRRMETRDRLASAVEFERESADPLLQKQITDAGSHAKSLDLRKAYPFKLSRESIAFIVLCLALIGAFWLPTLSVFWSKEKQQEMAQVKQQGIQIERIATDTQKAAQAKKLEEAAKAAKEAKKLAEAMKRGAETKKSSMIKLAKLTKDIEEQQRKMAQASAPNPKPMSQAAKEAKQALEQQQKAITQSVKTAEKNQAGKKGEKADAKDGNKADQQSKPGQKPGDSKQQSESMKQAQQALQKFAQALMDQNGEMQNQALQQLADQMEKGQMSQNEMQQLQQQLQDMANALKGSELDKAAQQMQQAANMMHQIKIDPETLKKLAQMMRQAGGT